MPVGACQMSRDDTLKRKKKPWRKFGILTLLNGSALHTCYRPQAPGDNLWQNEQAVRKNRTLGSQTAPI